MTGKLFIFILLVSAVIVSCNNKPGKDSVEKWKQEIVQTELDFAKLAKEEGIYKAFTTYAAEEAAINRNEKIISGKFEIDKFYNGKNSKGLSWKPDFVDVSSSGDLGYTYGRYTYSYTDLIGNPAESQGIFHTVWKRQPDGTWKFVWD